MVMFWSVDWGVVFVYIWVYFNTYSHDVDVGYGEEFEFVHNG